MNDDIVTFIDLAAEVEMSHTGFNYHIKMKRIPSGRLHFGWRVFTKDEAETIRQYFQSRKKYQHQKKEKTDE